MKYSQKVYRHLDRLRSYHTEVEWLQSLLRGPDVAFGYGYVGGGEGIVEPDCWGDEEFVVGLVRYIWGTKGWCSGAVAGYVLRLEFPPTPELPRSCFIRPHVQDEARVEALRRLLPNFRQRSTEPYAELSTDDLHLLGEYTEEQQRTIFNTWGTHYLDAGGRVDFSKIDETLERFTPEFIAALGDAGVGGWYRFVDLDTRFYSQTIELVRSGRLKKTFPHPMDQSDFLIRCASEQTLPLDRLVEAKLAGEQP